jgi:hypothetical protein
MWIWEAGARRCSMFQVKINGRVFTLSESEYMKACLCADNDVCMEVLDVRTK